MNPDYKIDHEYKKKTMCGLVMFLHEALHLKGCKSFNVSCCIATETEKVGINQQVQHDCKVNSICLLLKNVVRLNGIVQPNFN